MLRGLRSPLLSILRRFLIVRAGSYRPRCRLHDTHLGHLVYDRSRELAKVGDGELDGHRKDAHHRGPALGERRRRCARRRRGRRGGRDRGADGVAVEPDSTGDDLRAGVTGAKL